MSITRLTAVSLFLTFLLTNVSVNAATYYVATTGNDANPGSLQQPFRTISHAVGVLVAGDTLLVRGGTYSESVTVWGLNGTATAPIYISSYPGETAVIDGAGGGPGDSAVTIGESSHVRFDSFEVLNGFHGILVYDANNVKVRWNEVHSSLRHGILVTAADSSPAGTSHHVLVHENDVHHNVLENQNRTLTGGWGQGITGRDSTDVVISGNYVHENFGEGIGYMSSDTGEIRGNTVHDNYSANIYLDNAQFTSVDGNFVITGWSAAATDFYRDSAPANGILAANEYHTPQNPLTDLVFANNIVVRCKTGFMYWNGEYGGGLHNTVIANNTFSRSTRRSLTIENGTVDIHSTTAIKNNIFYATTGTDFVDDPSSATTYMTNCWYNGNSGTHRSGAGDVIADHSWSTRTGGARPISNSPPSQRALMLAERNPSSHMTSGALSVPAFTTSVRTNTDHPRRLRSYPRRRTWDGTRGASNPRGLFTFARRGRARSWMASRTPG
jgi:parallel beta-helix repeat protein